ncbi:hypothetical protein [Streptomyces sp. NPDC002825]|uniref:hypothetical protein n=1 Tax=Streptomyces sp. NPDC002825 TaxID=3154666 RepID=UPI0033342C02
MPRPSHTPLIGTVIGALLLSALLCLTPLGGAGHQHSTDRGPATTATLSLSTEHTEDQPPQHRHHNHGTDCSSSTLATSTHLATRHAPDALAPAASSGDTPASPPGQIRTPPDDRTPIAQPGRSTQTRVCRWRI